MEVSTALDSVEDSTLSELTLSMQTIESLFAEDVLVLERAIGELERLDAVMLSERERLASGAELASQLESRSSDDEFIAWSNLPWRLHRLKTITAVRSELKNANFRLEDHLARTRRGYSLFAARVKILEAASDKRKEDFHEREQTSLLNLVSNVIQS